MFTRCPHCLTAFRVSREQLTHRAGQVRCGACHHP
ncbi:MAG: zinc-ribbon domain-containing protein, partial [Zoogloeaceae bacterium]|nr:zinc-ribbon domain-containing protein [Zoogloeaceae bacterium]